MFPYVITGTKAEVYTRIPNGIKVNDHVRIDSNKETIYYYDNLGKQKTEGDIYIVDEPEDIEFINYNTMMK